MSCFNKSGIASVIFLFLLCLIPGMAFSDTALNRATAKASEILPVEEPELQSSDENLPKTAAALADASGLNADLTRDESKSGDRLINVSGEDKRAQRAINESLRMFTHTIKQRFSMWLERSGRYIEIMQGILKEKDMPTELVFLPIVESGFNPRAYSRAGAVGPWQFIEGTAKRYGLVVDWWRDERQDPVKSTVAAAGYLKDLYNMFGSWSLALAAYNAGEGRISKALKKSKTDDYWKLHSVGQIAQETKDYVPRFIAAAMIAKAPEKYGFEDLEYHEPFVYDEVVVYQPVDLAVVAKCAGTSVSIIKELNPELTRWSTPLNVKKYTLRIPAGKADSFVKKLSMIPKNRRFSYDKYIVRKNDNIKVIAAKAKVPVSAILELNKLAGIERLKTGEALRLPPHGKYLPETEDSMTALDTATDKLSKAVFAAGMEGGKTMAQTSDDRKVEEKRSRGAGGKKAVKKGKKIVSPK
jgi:membrane-bound lytic murein transglycosylase D